jgi:hypothetical protein
MAIKHVGRLKSNQRKVIVAYRTVPNDAQHCLCVQTENLTDSEHDALITCVESSAGQAAYEFAEAMHRYTLPDGRNMLTGFHAAGKLKKLPTASIEMTPDTKTTIGLDELNKIIAEQKGVTIDQLALNEGAPNTAVPPVEVDEIATVAPTPAPQSDNIETQTGLTDEDLAAKYRSDADRLFKEAKRLREQAEELAPTKRKTKTTESA